MGTNLSLNLEQELQSGDIVRILSVFTGKNKEHIENVLRTGITPWDYAKKCGVLEPLRNALLERIFTYLDAMVRRGQITRQYADDLIACFEMNIPAE